MQTCWLNSSRMYAVKCDREGDETVGLCFTLPLFHAGLSLPTFVFCLVQFSVSTLRKGMLR